MKYMSKSTTGFAGMNLKIKQMLSKSRILKEIINNKISFYSIPFRFLDDPDIVNSLDKLSGKPYNAWLHRAQLYGFKKNKDYKDLYLKIIMNSRHPLKWDMVPSYIREDKNLILKLISKNYVAFNVSDICRTIPSHILNEPEVITKLIDYGLPIHVKSGKKLKKDDLLRALKNGCINIDWGEHRFGFRNFRNKLLNDKDIAFFIIENFPPQHWPLKMKINDEMISKIIRDKVHSKHGRKFTLPFDRRIKLDNVNFKNLSDENLQQLFDYCSSSCLKMIKYDDILNLFDRNIKLSYITKDFLVNRAKSHLREKNNGNLDLFEFAIVKNNLNKLKASRLSDFKKHKNNFERLLENSKREPTVLGLCHRDAYKKLDRIQETYLLLPTLLKNNFEIRKKLIRAIKSFKSKYGYVDGNFIAKQLRTNCSKLQKYLLIHQLDCKVYESRFLQLNDDQTNFKKYILRRIIDHPEFYALKSIKNLNLDPYKDKDLIMKISKIICGRHNNISEYKDFWYFVSRCYSEKEAKELLLKALPYITKKQIKIVLNYYPGWRNNFCVIKEVYRNNFECLEFFNINSINSKKFNNFISCVKPPYITSVNHLIRSQLLNNRLFVAQYIYHRPDRMGKGSGGSNANMTILQAILRKHSFHHSISDCILKFDPRSAKHLDKEDFYKLDTTNLSKLEKICVYNAYRSVVHKSMLKHSRFKKQLLAEMT